MFKYNSFRLLLIFCSFLFAPLLYAEGALIDLQNGVMLSQPRDIQFFTLYDFQGQKFTNANLQGKWTLMFFGFTNCPALCPTTMAELGNAYNQLTKNHISPLPQVVFVSVDPQRDTAQKVHLFATTFNKNFIGLRTDDLKTLNQITKDMSVMFTKIPSNPSNRDRDANATYTIDHSGEIIVLNPQGQLIALLTMPHTAHSIMADYSRLIAGGNVDNSLGALKK